jgi:CheY-like chemotaxis protein
MNLKHEIPKAGISEPLYCFHGTSNGEARSGLILKLDHYRVEKAIDFFVYTAYFKHTENFLRTTRMTAPYGRQVILLAEDDAAVCPLLRSFLEEEAYDVLVASNGNEALEQSRVYVGSIDLFVADIMMPFVDGITAYKHLSKERPNMKVLFLSDGLNPPEPWPFLSKPFELARLRKAVNQIVSVRPTVESQESVVVLVVDTNSARRDRTTRILDENGCAVLTANNAEEAKAIAHSIARIDLIIIEVVFSARDMGIQFAETVQASELDSRALLISRFAPGIFDDRRGFSRQPEFLPNPFTAEALLAPVYRLLSGRRGIFGSRTFRS